MRLIRPRFEFRVKLDPHEPGVAGQLNDFNETSVRGESGHIESFFGQDLTKSVVKLVTVAVALGDDVLTIGPIAERVGTGQVAEVSAQAHSTALVSDLPLFGHQVDDGIACPRVKLAGVGVRKTCDIARELDHGHLHTQADPKEGDILLTGIADGGDLTINAPVAETAGDKDPVATF